MTVLLGGAGLQAATAGTEPGPEPVFDWTLAPRTTVDASGRAVYRTTVEEITPEEGFEVQLDACASVPGGDAPLTSWHWRIEQDEELVTDTCLLDLRLDEGTYRVALTVVDEDGERSPTTTREVVVQDWLIVAFGDSYGSGEGAPDGPLDAGALQQLESAWGDLGSALDDVADAAAAAAAALTDYEQTQQQFAEFEAAWDAYWDTPFIPVDEYLEAQSRLLAAAAVLGITAGEETILNLWDAARHVLDGAEAAWRAAVAAHEAALAAVTLLTQSIDAYRSELSADWQDQLCHRSGNSGAFQAAHVLEQLDPRTSVTFVHLACSGATVLEGIVGNYAGSSAEPDLHPDGGLDPQPVVASHLVAGREVDAITTSIGGNDAHFASIITACIIQPDCSADSPPFPGAADATAAATDRIAAVCAPFQGLVDIPLTGWNECRDQLEAMLDRRPELVTMTGKDIFEVGIEGGMLEGEVQQPLAERYEAMDAFIFDQPDEVRLLRPDRRDRLYLSEYPELTRDEGGTLCHGAAHGLRAIPGWSLEETTWADGTVTPTLNGVIAEAAATHGWTLVDGVQAGYRDRGYCAQDGYIVRLQDSFANQMQIEGAVHPNTAGFAVYAHRILAAMLPDLYPVTGPDGGRDLTQPRRPDQIPIADAGGDRTVDEGSTLVLDNDTWDADGDELRIGWTLDGPEGVATLSPSSAAEPTLQAIDDGTVTVTITVADEDTDWFGTAPLPSATATITVENVPPAVGPLDLPDGPVLVGEEVTLVAPFVDPGVLDAPFTASWSFGDGTEVTCASGAPVTTAPGCDLVDVDGAGTTTVTHAYAEAGTYEVGLSVTDSDGDAGHLEGERTIVVVEPGPDTTGPAPTSPVPGGTESGTQVREPGPPAGAAAAGAPSGLPRTGEDVSLLLLAAAFLVLFGATAVLAPTARRGHPGWRGRRTRTPGA